MFQKSVNIYAPTDCFFKETFCIKIRAFFYLIINKFLLIPNNEKNNFNIILNSL